MNLKPIDCATINERWELPESITKCISNRTHRKYYMKVLSTSINKVVEE